MILNNREYRIILDGLIALQKRFSDKYENYESLGEHQIALSVNQYLGEIIHLKHKIKQGTK